MQIELITKELNFFFKFLTMINIRAINSEHNKYCLQFEQTLIHRMIDIYAESH